MATHSPITIADTLRRSLGAAKATAAALTAAAADWQVIADRAAHLATEFDYSEPPSRSQPPEPTPEAYGSAIAYALAERRADLTEAIRIIASTDGSPLARLAGAATEAIRAGAAPPVRDLTPAEQDAEARAAVIEAEDAEAYYADASGDGEPTEWQASAAERAAYISGKPA